MPRSRLCSGFYPVQSVKTHNPRPLRNERGLSMFTKSSRMCRNCGATKLEKGCSYGDIHLKFSLSKKFATGKLLASYLLKEESSWKETKKLRKRHFCSPATILKQTHLVFHLITIYFSEIWVELPNKTRPNKTFYLIVFSTPELFRKNPRLLIYSNRLPVGNNLTARHNDNKDLCSK